MAESPRKHDASRASILAALRAASPPDAPLPEVPLFSPERYADPVARLTEAVAAVGGTCVRVPNAEDLGAEVAALAARLGAKIVASTVGRATTGNVRLDQLTDPHQLEGIDLAVLPGVLAVAENGAVWVDTRAFPHRGVFVVAQHLALVVAPGAIVNDMHEAYARVRLEGPGFRLFIAGPSKTADIEQALVIGAHGARSCTVFVAG